MKILHSLPFINIFTFFLTFIKPLEARDSFKEIKTMLPDVCNLSFIYHSDYQYSLPKPILESYLSGKAFDHPNEYTHEELERLKTDIRELYQSIMSTNPIKYPVAIMTAGAPGSGKTTLLNQDREEYPMLDRSQYAYICPDDVCLKKQTTTYLADIDNSDKSPAARQQAYNKWRPGSNAATHLILANLIREKYAFYFGTTSSGPATNKFFEFLKTQGYTIRLMHVSAPDDVRWESIKERDQTFIQTTEKDTREKGLLLPQRIQDTFLKYADEIEFYYRGGVKENAILAAEWLRNAEGEKKLGSLQIKNQDLYEKIKNIHNEAINTLSRPDLTWEETVEKSSQIIEYSTS